MRFSTWEVIEIIFQWNFVQMNCSLLKFKLIVWFPKFLSVHLLSTFIDAIFFANVLSAVAAQIANERVWLIVRYLIEEKKRCKDKDRSRHDEATVVRWLLFENERKFLMNKKKNSTLWKHRKSFKIKWILWIIFSNLINIRNIQHKNFKDFFLNSKPTKKSNKQKQVKSHT